MKYKLYNKKLKLKAVLVMQRKNTELARGPNFKNPNMNIMGTGLARRVQHLLYEPHL